MKSPRFFQFLPALAAGLLLAAPATSFADRKITVYRDNDGDGHYNKKTIKVDKHRHYGGRYYDNRYYSNRYYGSGYPYRSYNYGYRPYYYTRPSVSLSFSRPVYSSRSYSSSYSESLAVDVQRELRRRGYYRGAIDGDVGPGTRSAIRAYQDDRGLAVTGRIDRSLLRALGIG